MAEELHFTIAAEMPTSAEVLALIKHHLEEMHRCSPACKVHALPAERLTDSHVTFYTARVDGELAAIGALRAIDMARGEIKSMRTVDAWRGKGAGEALLRHLIATARSEGLVWLGLETGRHAVFEPALRLYNKHGFTPAAAFADYVTDEFSQCLSLDLTR